MSAAYLSVHRVTRISAESSRTSAAPLSLTLTRRDGGEPIELTFFTNDQKYTDALIEAINKVNADREADKLIDELASEAEAA